MEGEQSFEGESEYISQKPKRMVFAGVQKHGRIKNKTLRPGDWSICKRLYKRMLPYLAKKMFDNVKAGKARKMLPRNKILAPRR